MIHTTTNLVARYFAGLLLAATSALAQSPPPPSVQAPEPSGSRTAQAATPRDPRSPVAGCADGRGPTGPVQLKIVSPVAGEEIPLPETVANGASVRVVLDLKNYETFFDPVTKTGQAVALFLDGLPYFAHYQVSLPWVFRRVAPGTHTLRAIPIRPWGDPIREEGAFASVTFSVGPKAEKNAPAPGEPILTVLSPKFRARYSPAQAASLTFTFAVTGCTLSDVPGPGTCRVRYRIDDNHEVILSRPDPALIQGLTPGRHRIAAGITRDNKLVPGAFTLVQSFFDIQEPTAPATSLPDR